MMFFATAFPLKFIKVLGFNKKRDLDLYFIVQIDPNLQVSNSRSFSSANEFKISNPILCRVFSYSNPGLPNPTIKNFTFYES